MRRRAALAVALIVFAGCGSSGGQPSYGAKAVTSANGLRLVKVGTFDTPTYVQGPPGEGRDRVAAVRVR